MLLGVNNQKANTADNQLIWGLTNHRTKKYTTKRTSARAAFSKGILSQTLLANP